MTQKMSFHAGWGTLFALLVRYGEQAIDGNRDGPALIRSGAWKRHLFLSPLTKVCGRRPLALKKLVLTIIDARVVGPLWTAVFAFIARHHSLIVSERAIYASR